jgi:hypothetical protein
MYEDVSREADRLAAEVEHLRGVVAKAAVGLDASGMILLASQVRGEAGLARPTEEIRGGHEAAKEEDQP